VSAERNSKSETCEMIKYNTPDIEKSYLFMLIISAKISTVKGVNGEIDRYFINAKMWNYRPAFSIEFYEKIRGRGMLKMQDQRLLEGGRLRSHSIHIDDRRLMSVSGVKDVDSFNEQFVQLLTEAGELRIEGADLHITKLNLDEGQIMLEGEVTAMEYAETEERGSLFGRIFR